MRVVICAMAKNEHLYINEWVRHYVNLGVDKIYLYDNDEIDSPNVADFIDNDLKEYVCIIDIRGQKGVNMQHKIYTKFYNTFKDDFDWCLFCDIDEYLFGIQNFKSWLMQPKLKNAKQIRVKWKLFGDSGYIRRDMTKSVVETFTKEVKTTYNRALTKKANLQNQAKCILRGGMINVKFFSAHFACFGSQDRMILSMLPSGKWCFSGVTLKEDYKGESVYLHHYMTKSLSEFVAQKLNRNDAVFNTSIPLTYYWRINEKTTEKLEYLKNLGLLEQE